MRLEFLLIPLAGLAGCGLGDSARHAPPPLGPDLPPAYVVGFRHGYHSACEPTEFYKHTDPYATEQYRQGWKAGYRSGAKVVRQERQKAQRCSRIPPGIGAAHSMASQRQRTRTHRGDR
jgi:hypothetical protein